MRKMDDNYSNSCINNNSHVAVSVLFDRDTITNIQIHISMAQPSRLINRNCSFSF